MGMKKNDKMNKILCIMGKGGHAAQMLRLIEKMGKNYKYEYVLIKGHEIAIERIPYLGKILKISKHGAKTDGFFISVKKMFKCIIDSIEVLFKIDAKFVLTTGGGEAIPLAILCKIAGKKLICIESWSRIYNKSNTGRFLYTISDLFIVQWPSMKKKYPKSVYAGRFG